ncbi:MAG: carboxypeptidase-like regulatory domain-containing protein [Bacteroidetes bacterium]|nr:carboxypeptidase-like regulatory domain-containing protein [Bacteroidota bacterium]
MLLHKPSKLFFQTRPLLLSAFCVFCSVLCYSQLNYDFTEGKFLIKGKVVDLQTKAPIAMTNVRINGTSKGTTCDNDGVFATYVSKTDTLKFSSTGYLSKVMHMEDVDSTKYYILQIELLHDFIKLKEVTIYPYRDMDEFKKAFIEAKDMQRASMYGLTPPKYTNNIPKPKFYNPVSFLYERLKKKKRAADPDFKP